MKTLPPALARLARFVSVIGHPLLLGSLVALFLSFRAYGIRQAIIAAGIIIGVITLPVTLFIYRKTRSGVYSNFDISVRQQRTSFYFFLIGAFVLATAILLLTHQPWPLTLGVGFALGMMAICFGVNFFIKASLHSAMAFFLSFTVMFYSYPLGVAMLVFAVLVGISRLLLGRHTLREICSGGIIGILTGLGLLWALCPAA
ncbi:PAP2 superfamily protein [Chitinophaga costaii]|uniref:PAP2 superfamily protein n=1 Tax=Chitinophaga costaii TaxID=1335309 RepID=A0A1C4F897_9BACT|nr:phosphatase PAP2 family protein [Chitinophaga costaii]PUZ21212.1 phosphatase PAP2 family protein [Chitinophaga costaii]SCC51905.1 PAP2 superfamily protein [Chitinophaga costaii]